MVFPLLVCHIVLLLTRYDQRGRLVIESLCLIAQNYILESEIFNGT